MRLKLYDVPGIHPPHGADVAAGVKRVTPPPRPAGWIARWKESRACRRFDGHWWHPDAATMTGWFCCRCGTERDGQPADGT